MKKTPRKLTLAKETIRDLEELTQVQGGLTLSELSCTARHCPKTGFPSL